MECTNISTPSAFGVEWTNLDSGNTYQVVNPRHTTDLTYNCRVSGERLWLPVHIQDPATFGMVKIPHNYDEFFAVAQKFIQ